MKTTQHEKPYLMVTLLLLLGMSVYVFKLDYFETVKVRGLCENLNGTPPKYIEINNQDMRVYDYSISGFHSFVTIPYERLRVPSSSDITETVLVICKYEDVHISDRRLNIF